MIKSNNKITDKVMQILENNGKSVLDILKEKDSVCIPTHTLDCILEDEEVTIEEIKDYLDAIRNLSRGNYDYKPKTRFVRILFADLERFIKSNNESYVAKASRNIDNGKKGGRPRKTQWVSLGFENNPKKADNVYDNDNDNDNDNDYDNGNDCETIEEVSPIVVVDKNNNKPLLAKVPVKQQCDSTGFELKNLSPVEVAEKFDNGNLPYKSVLITAYKVFCSHTGTNDDKWRKSVDECKNFLYWKTAVNCVYFTGADIASILKVGVAIDNVIKQVGKQPAMESVFKIMQNICTEGKYKDKSIEEKTRILIGSINKFEKDCKKNERLYHHWLSLSYTTLLKNKQKKS